MTPNKHIDPAPVCELADKIAQLTIALHESPINDREDCWTHQLDPNWFLAVNGRPEATTVPDTPERIGFTLGPYQFLVWWNGWLAGYFDGTGQGWIVNSEVANEEDLLKALDKKLAALAESTK